MSDRTWRDFLTLTGDDPSAPPGFRGPYVPADENTTRSGYLRLSDAPPWRSGIHLTVSDGTSDVTVMLDATQVLNITAALHRLTHGRLDDYLSGEEDIVAPQLNHFVFDSTLE